jgi:excisionase family DNA binding protein
MNGRSPATNPNITALVTERLVTDVELAKRLGISRRHVQLLRAGGQLRAVRLGCAVRFPLNENLGRVLGSPNVEISAQQGTALLGSNAFSPSACVHER